MGTIAKYSTSFGRIIEAFKSSRSEKIKQTLLGKGFKQFDESAQLQIVKGLKASYLDKFLAHLVKRLKVPKERQNDLKDVLEETKWVDNNTWMAFNTIYSVNVGGQTKFCSILIGKTEGKKGKNQDTYDALISDVEATFQLAPNVLVIEKNLSILGGLWADTSIEYKDMPRSITHEDVKAVLEFFTVVAFKGFADQFGISYKMPSFK